MLTVGFCTRKSDKSYIEHIKNTCGVKDVEIIEFVNNGISLASAYNSILSQAKHDIVVLCHDDLIFNKKGWGKSIVNDLTNTEYGIIGLAGTTKLSDTGVWWGHRELMVGCVSHLHEGKVSESVYCPPNKYGILETVVIDGLFIGINKSKIKHSFDEEFNGFHYYDIPFCLLNHKAGVKVGVTFDIKVTHKSIGITNQSWETNRVKFVEKYKESLPLEIGGKLFYSDSIVKVKKEPKVAIIIPTKSKLHLLFDCIDSILTISNYKNYNIYIADTGSSVDEKDEIKTRYSNNSNIKLIEYDYYNFAEINNDVVNNHLSDEECLLFCNNDIKLINDAISRMVNVYLSKHNIGTVGCRLHFGDGKIQHAGILSFKQKDQYYISHTGLNSWYNYKDSPVENKFGSTAAFLLVNRNIFNKVGGFVRTSECFEDVVLNVKIHLAGYKNMFSGDAVCYHYESQSRNDDSNKLNRLQRDYVDILLPFLKNNESKLY